MAGLLDFITGGKNTAAEDALKRAEQAYAGIQAPTAQQMTLPELQKYAIAANMTPAQMQAFLQQNNALAQENVPQEGTQAQIQALNQLAQVANAGAEGTPTERAQVQNILNEENTNLAGQRGAIEQQAEARGVPPGLLAAALSSQYAGQDASRANQGALQAQSQAYQQALNAMAQGANVGQGLQGQQNTQANTVAAAQNAMQQFNAANQQNAAAQNAQYQQQANELNTNLANTVGQANTGLANQRTQYNTQLPQQVFNNALQKAAGQSGVNQAQANNYTAQGQQGAGLTAGLLGAGATLAAGPLAGLAVNQAMKPQQTGYQYGPPASANTQQYAPFAHGGMVDCNMKSGGQVPGHAQHPGDTEKNDTVHAMLSPGEYVLPRSVVQNHPEDVAALLAAMRHLRGGR
jgi:hypothetical protein